MKYGHHHIILCNSILCEGRSTMKTNELLFELSHSVRYEIMKALAAEPLKLTKLGELVGANNPEVSRHLDRLREAKMVNKNPDGGYGLTPTGRLVMAMLPGFTFVADNIDWLGQQDLSGLPSTFITRLGNLTSYRMVKGFVDVSGAIIGIYESMEEHYRICTHVIRPETAPMFRDKIADGFDIRFIIDESLQLSAEVLEQISSYGEHWRVVPKIPALFAFSERSAFVEFPTSMGGYDFSSGLYSDEPAFRQWCEELFEYLWSQGRPLFDQHI